MLKLQLGSGEDIWDGWVNIDSGFHIEKPNFINWDLTGGLPHEIEANSVDFIFSQHFMEHIERDHALTLLRDCYQKLKSGGVIRMSVPDLDACIDRYLKNDLPRGGSWSPPNRCVMINEDFRAWGHTFMYNKANFSELFMEAGFKEFSFPEYKESKFEELKGRDSRRIDDLRIEAVKP